MKRLEFYIKFLPLIVALAVITAGCNKGNPEKEEIVDELQAQDVTFTPCVQSKVGAGLASALANSDVDVSFTNEGVQITYSDFAVTCDFSEVNVTHTFVNGFLNITQKGTPNEADCVCYTDVSYTIKGVSQQDVNVIFINGVQVYCYNENVETLEGTYIGTFRSLYTPENSVWSGGIGETTLTLKNGKYFCTGNPGMIPAGGSGNYSIIGNKIIFEDENGWYANFDWNLILCGEYDFTFDGKNLKISKSNEYAYYEYNLEKVEGMYDCDQDVIICADEYENAHKRYLVIEDLKIENNCLKIKFSGSGCDGSSWVVKLIDKGLIAESGIPQRFLILSQNSQEWCRAWITKEISFNIEELQVKDCNKVYLNIAYFDGEIFSKAILYEY